MSPIVKKLLLGFLVINVVFLVIAILATMGAMG